MNIFLASLSLFTTLIFSAPLSAQEQTVSGSVNHSAIPSSVSSEDVAWRNLGAHWRFRLGSSLCEDPNPALRLNGYAGWNSDVSQAWVDLENKGSSRAEFLLALDGKNPLSGKVVLHQSRGFVVGPGQHLRVPLNLSSSGGSIWVEVHSETVDAPTLTDAPGSWKVQDIVYTKTPDGRQLWTPPMSAPFRRKNNRHTPDALSYVAYQVSPGVCSASKD